MASAARKPRAYKDILNAALHRRFIAATLRVLIPLCCLISFAVDQGESMPWKQRSIGSIIYFLCAFSIRAGLLLICVLSIFILRVSQWHVGKRTTKSPADTFYQYLFHFRTIQAALYYLTSAWLFCEIYVYSAPKEAGISWIVPVKLYDRKRLNEKPIYLMTFFLLCAILQTFCHVLFDYDQIDISPDLNDQKAEKAPATRFSESLVPAFIQCLTKTIIITALAPFIYVFLVRECAWNYTFKVAKYLSSLQSNSSGLPVKYPFHVMLLGRCLLGGGLLFSMWNISNLAFSIYVGQPPLKKGKPITDESNDPNKTLLIGLTSSKLLLKSFAFAELQHIACVDDKRRETIYRGIERPDGSIWPQLFNASIENINVVNDRITNYLKPPAPTKSDLDALSDPPRDEPMPFIGTPLKDDLVIARTKASPNSINFRNSVGKFVKSLGESPEPYHASQALFEQGAKYAPGLATEAASAKNLYQSVWMYILKSPIGYLFQHTFRRKATAVVLGSPYGELSLISCAITSLSELAVRSVQEDPYGSVQKNIREIFEVFTTTVENLEAVEQKLLSEIDWSDVDFQTEDGSDVVPEIDILLKILRASLQDLIAAFANYSDAMTLDSKLMRRAREAAVDLRKKKKKEVKKSDDKTGVNATKPPQRQHSRAPRNSSKEGASGKEKPRGKGNENEKANGRRLEEEPEMQEHVRENSGADQRRWRYMGTGRHTDDPLAPPPVLGPQDMPAAQRSDWDTIFGKAGAK